MKLRDFTTSAQRKTAVEKETKTILSHIGKFSFDEKIASSKNCENMIGATQVPLGIAGPLELSNQQLATSHQQFYIPLATTEGALIASVNRGCKVITESGGTTIVIEKIGVTRAPVFVVENITHGKKVAQWVKKSFLKLKKITEKTSSHLTLLKIETSILGSNIFIKFYFDTQDAMGMNMATIAVNAAIPFIEKETGAKLAALSSNMCVDKKASYENFIKGRGFRVWADVLIPDKIVTEILKTSIEKVVDSSQRKLFYGSVLSGSMGANAHYANVLAAIFLSTGQDMAHIAECCMGITTVEKHEKGLYVSVYLPDLMIGTVGGGTELATQKEALSILGIVGGNKGKNSEKFAGIIAGAVLAGELSLLASLSNNTLASAHETFARGKS